MALGSRYGWGKKGCGKNWYGFFFKVSFGNVLDV